MVIPWEWGMLVRVPIVAQQMAHISVRLFLIHLGQRGRVCEVHNCLSIALVLEEETQDAEGGKEGDLNNSPSCSKEGA